MTGTRPSAPVSTVLLMSAGRALYGAALLAAPGPILAVAAGQAPSRRDRAVARVLGARHVAQALVSAAAGRQALAPGAVVDGLHAASMVGLAARRGPGDDGSIRRAELADAAVASLLAVLGLLFAQEAGARG